MFVADYISLREGALIGRHFKSLAQVMPYLIYDLVPQTVLDGWSVIGRLVVLLWHTAIENTELYLVSFSIPQYASSVLIQIMTTGKPIAHNR